MSPHMHRKDPIIIRLKENNVGHNEELCLCTNAFQSFSQSKTIKGSLVVVSDQSGSSSVSVIMFKCNHLL